VLYERPLKSQKRKASEDDLNAYIFDEDATEAVTNKKYRGCFL
jgi:hypothetical protein